MKHFCVLPWVHAEIHQSGDVYPCCRMGEAYSLGSMHERSFDEIWNAEPLRQMRLGLLRDEPQPQCRVCYASEERGEKSLREQALEDFADSLGRVDATSLEGHVATGGLLSLDLRFSNVCNFRCRICGPHNSTAWGPGPARARLSESRGDFWPWLESKLGEIRVIQLAGGEPLLHEDHYLLLEKLLSRGRTDVVLKYNSNLSVTGFRHWDVAALWSRFERVHLTASFDGVGEAAELIRKGQDWAATEERFLSLRERLPKARFDILYTLGAMNAFHLPAALDRFLETGMVRAPDEFRVNLLEGPPHLSLAVFAPEERDELRSLYLAYLARLRARLAATLHSSLERAILPTLTSLDGPFLPEERANFRRTAFELDRSRGEKLVRVFPELLGPLYLN
jgi:radical SAM protein with 4Fe4S-binding SPASM domain